MAVDTRPFSLLRRTPPLADATSAALALPDPNRSQDEGGEPFTRLRTRGGRPEYLTPWGRAYRIGGRWFIGIPARLVTVPDTIQALDAAEMRQP